MTITLLPDQLAWIEARVARGDYGSVDEAVRDLVAAGIEGRAEAADDDMAWAKPLVDEALAEIERGEFEVVGDIDAYLERLFHPERSRWRASKSAALRRSTSPASPLTCATEREIAPPMHSRRESLPF